MEINDRDQFDLTGQVMVPGFVPAEMGCYSLVYRGIWRGNQVAVKVIKPVGALKAMRRKVRRERTVWEALEHPNILPFYGHADDEHFGSFGAFISPWCFNGDAGRFLAENGRHMEAAERVELWKGVLSGVAFLHTRKPMIVHGDLKPGNVLIDNNRSPRICDFGLARIIQEAGASGMTTTTEHTGTERYLAPELVASSPAKPTTASDIYALGCLGLEFIYLERPYADQQTNHLGCIIIDIREGVAPASRQEDIHSPLDFWWGSLRSWELIETLWCLDPEGRPAAVSVITHLAAPNPSFDDTHTRRGIGEHVPYSPLDHEGESIYYQERRISVSNTLHTVETLPRFGGLLNFSESERSATSQQSPPSSHPFHPSLHAASYTHSHISPSSRTGERGGPSAISNTSNPRRSPDHIPNPYNDEASSNKKKLVIVTSDAHPDRPSRLNIPRTVLYSRFTRHGELADVEEAISTLQQAVDLTPDVHPDKSNWLSKLVVALHSRYERLGSPTDMDDAILSLQHAAVLTSDVHPDKPSRLSSLGTTLHSRFKRHGELADIEKAISIQQQAVELTPDGHPDKSSRLSNLGNALHSRFMRRGELTDIEGAISTHQRAVNLTPDGHPDMSSRLSKLGVALHCRFTRRGELADIEGAILNLQQAVDLTPDVHPDKSSRLSKLGVALHSRFIRHCGHADINGAVSIHQQVVNITPSGLPDKPRRLDKLGAALHSRFMLRGELTDIEGAISVHQQAVDLTPDGHPDMSSRLSKLRVALHCLFTRRGELADIEGAILNLGHAVELTPGGHPDKSSRLSNLELALLSRSMHSDRQADMGKAISINQQPANLMPDGHSDNPTPPGNHGERLDSGYSPS